MPTQQQPALDTPAVEQHPMIEHVVETVRHVGSEKSNVLFATVASYVCSVGIGLGIAYLFFHLFGPSDLNVETAAQDRLMGFGFGISVLTAFLLGLLFPLLFARNKRMLAVLLTVILQFITLAVLIIIGLSQIPATDLARSLMS